MKYVILLINHIHFPYRIFEESLGWARMNGCPHKTIFLTSESLQQNNNKHYVFDVDLPDSAALAGTFINPTGHYLDELRRFIITRAEYCNVTASTYVLIKPTLQLLNEKLQYSKKVFLGFQRRELPEELIQLWNVVRRFRRHSGYSMV
jgi:hypothetical protein